MLMRNRAALAPADLDRTWEQVFPGTPDQLRHVRAAIGAFLDGCSAADDVALLASELCANAIAHSASGQPGGTFAVRVRHAHGDRVHAEVRDGGSDWHGDIGRSASGPHGLYLLLALAADCGTGGDGGSRIVWFRLEDLP
jgi:serine/threonine-protein kinase RsbW